jgi:hypothetical protein
MVQIFTITSFSSLPPSGEDTAIFRAVFEEGFNTLHNIFE